MSRASPLGRLLPVRQTHGTLGTSSSSSTSKFAPSTRKALAVVSATDENFLTPDVLLCLLAESEQYVKDLEAACVPERSRCWQGDAPVSTAEVEKEAKEVVAAVESMMSGSWLQPATLRASVSSAGSDFSRSRLGCSDLGSDRSSAAGNEAICSIREAIVQLEPMPGSEVVWTRLGTVVEELASLRIRVLEQSRRNRQLRREVDLQHEMLVKISDLERQNKMFAERTGWEQLACSPVGCSPEANKWHALRRRKQMTLPMHENLEGLLPASQVSSARCHRERHRMVREELLAEQQRRRIRRDSEQVDRDMVPQLQQRVQKATEAIDAAKARIADIQAARAQVKEALGVDAPHLCSRLGLGSTRDQEVAKSEPVGARIKGNDTSSLSAGGVFGLRAGQQRLQKPVGYPQPRRH